MPEHDAREVRPEARAGEVAADRVQRRRAPLPQACRLRLLADARRQPAERERHDEHDAEGEQEPGVGDGEPPIRRHEHHVEARHREQCREDRGSPSVTRRREHHREQVEHGGVDLGDRPLQRPRQQRDQRDDPGSPRIVAPRTEPARPRLGRRFGRRLVGAHPDVQPPGATDQAPRDAERQQQRPACTRGADEDPRRVVLARPREDLVGGIVPGHRDRAAAELLGEPQRLLRCFPPRGGQRGVARQLHVQRGPRCLQLPREPSGRAHQAQRPVGGRDAHQQPLARGPRLGDARGGAPPAHLRVHPLRRAAQCQLPERDQVAPPEEAVERALRLVRHVHLALAEPLLEHLGRHVDQLELVGLVEQGIRHRLAHDHAGDLGDDVVQALDVLDVERAVHVDPGPEELLHVLVPLRVPGARCVGVGQLVEQQEGRSSGQRAVEVELLDRRAAMLEPPSRNQRQAFRERGGLAAAVRLHHADHHVLAAGTSLPRGLQHAERLAHARRRAHEDLQPPATRTVRSRGQREQGIRVGAVVGLHVGTISGPARSRHSRVRG